MTNRNSHPPPCRTGNSTETDVTGTLDMNDSGGAPYSEGDGG